jgi:hypothetical protein
MLLYQAIILEMLQTLNIIHNNVYTFRVTVTVYKTAAYCHLWMKCVEN